MGQKAAFLDRDGTISVERGHILNSQELALLPGSASAIQALRADGWKVLVVTNQSHVARGLITETELVVIHRDFEQMVLDAGAALDGLYYCPHHPNGAVPKYSFACDCRKPRPGMLLQAAREHGVDLRKSVLVGDALRDIKAGQAAGIRHSILVRTGHGQAVERQSHGADHVADDLAAAVTWIASR
jgi:D-glycero-D-manno-heptose 1,7-bisphosphate phosphatase